MLDLIVKGTRIAVVMFWVAMALSLVSVIPGPYGPPIIWIGGLVLLIHLAQYLFVKSIFAGRYSEDFSFVQTMLFGFTHWLPLLINGQGKRQ